MPNFAAEGKPSLNSTEWEKNSHDVGVVERVSLWHCDPHGNVIYRFIMARKKLKRKLFMKKGLNSIDRAAMQSSPLPFSIHPTKIFRLESIFYC